MDGEERGRKNVVGKSGFLVFWAVSVAAVAQEHSFPPLRMLFFGTVLRCTGGGLRGMGKEHTGSSLRLCVVLRSDVFVPVCSLLQDVLCVITII